jgi:phosphoribosylaminoimidazolecarboxamide formyltransferase/IMP cyclohydrolase
MTDNQELGLRKIGRALISVSDKTGIVDFARELKDFGVEIISTGGTARALREAGIDVRDVSDVTGFPEMMDGRIKTLHPKIHGALLGIRDNPKHQLAMHEQGIEPIDMVVVNLYPFETTIAREGVTFAEAIEQIDIGGPAMIRSAAKNFAEVTVVVSPDMYEDVVEEMKHAKGQIPLAMRHALATQAYLRTANYDTMVGGYFLAKTPVATTAKLQESIVDREIGEPRDGDFPPAINSRLRKLATLRYGENPHQSAALYSRGPVDAPHRAYGVAGARVLAGKEMSFNNYVDADAAWELVCDFEELACAIIKHTNPAGAALGKTGEEAYRRALACDPVSAFGGIVAFNSRVDEAAARAVIEIFTEVIIAPGYDEAALKVLQDKKNLRVLDAGEPSSKAGWESKEISGGILLQAMDTHRMPRADLKVVTRRPPSSEEIENLLFAWTVCKHTKSNAIVYVRDKQTVGVGAGQMSRVDSVKLGAMRAQLPVTGSVLASDAFFPFRDGLDEAAKHGITAVIQPGGSMRDAEVIAAADEHGLAMVFTGIRHFKH